MSLPCFDSEGNYEELSIDDIVYVELLIPKSEKLLFHTYRGDYIFGFKGTLDTFLTIYNHRGFEDLDSGNIVNMNKIKCVDRKLWVVHFDNNLQAHVSRRNKKKVSHIIDCDHENRLEH